MNSVKLGDEDRHLNLDEYQSIQRAGDGGLIIHYSSHTVTLRCGEEADALRHHLRHDPDLVELYRARVTRPATLRERACCCAQELAATDDLDAILAPHQKLQQPLVAAAAERAIRAWDSHGQQAAQEIGMEASKDARDAWAAAFLKAWLEAARERLVGEPGAF